MSSAPLPSPIDDDDRKSVVSSIAKVDSHTPADHVYPELSTARAVLLVASMTLTVVLHTASIQGTVLSLTHMGQDFNMAPASYQWPTLAYSLAFSSLLLLFGRLADVHGHRPVYFFGMAWFALFSLVAAVANGEILLDVAKAMQGLAMSAAMPAALGILGSTFAPGPRKTRALACFSGGAPVGGGVGSVLGGLCAEYAPIGWRAFFYITLGSTIGISGLAWLSIPPKAVTRSSNSTVDWLGGFLVTAGLVLVTFALSDGSSEPKGWRTPFIPALFSVGVLLCCAFWAWERHLEYTTSRPPLMRTSLWFKGRFAAVAILALVGYATFAPFAVFSTTWNETVLVVGSLNAAIRFLPACVMGAVLCGLVAVLAPRVDANWLGATGCVGLIVSPLLFALQGLDDSYWRWQFPAFVITAFGPDFVYSVGVMYTSQMADVGDQALAGGILNMMTQVGTSIGLCISTVIQTRVVKHKLGKLGVTASPEATEAGLRAVFYGCIGFAAAALVISLVFLRGVGKVGLRKQQADAVVPGESAEVKQV